MTDPAGRNPLDWSHATTEIPERGLKHSRSATEPERAELSAALGLLSCEALEATYHITAIAGGVFRLEGGLDAAVTQACVISLEPVSDRVAESFSIEFKREIEDQAADGDVQILSAPEVEPIVNDRIEVGRLFYETLAAGLNPYPRAPDAELDWTDAKAAAAAAASHPFAALKKLKDPG